MVARTRTRICSRPPTLNIRPRATPEVQIGFYPRHPVCGSQSWGSGRVSACGSTRDVWLRGHACCRTCLAIILTVSAVVALGECVCSRYRGFAGSDHQIDNRGPCFSPFAEPTQLTPAPLCSSPIPCLQPLSASPAPDLCSTCSNLPTPPPGPGRCVAAQWLLPRLN